MLWEIFIPILLWPLIEMKIYQIKRKHFQKAEPLLNTKYRLLVTTMSREAELFFSRQLGPQSISVIFFAFSFGR
jgi:hypothetical protein